jgi:hypothetical protein
LEAGQSRLLRRGLLTSGHRALSAQIPAASRSPAEWFCNAKQIRKSHV